MTDECKKHEFEFSSSEIWAPRHGKSVLVTIIWRCHRCGQTQKVKDRVIARPR